jgi:hypothetical protein
MNFRFDDIELASLGLSVREFDGRSMPNYATDTVILSNRRKADVTPGASDPGSTVLQGTLSADTDSWEDMTHENWLARLDELKRVISPRKGYRKLVVSGDQPDRFRMCRYSSMSLVEAGPGLLKRPFHPISISFENFEPYWREPAPTVQTTQIGEEIPNGSSDDCRPLVTLIVSGEINAASGSKVDRVVLLQVDDFQICWRGVTGSGSLANGDSLIVNSESLTCHVQRAMSTSLEDVIRFYDFGGPGAFRTDGFARVAMGGSKVTYVHPKIGQATFEYDLLHS